MRVSPFPMSQRPSTVASPRVSRRTPAKTLRSNRYSFDPPHTVEKRFTTPTAVPERYEEAPGVTTEQRDEFTVRTRGDELTGVWP